MSDIPWSLILGALPSIAALIKVFTPTGERGLARRVTRLAEIRSNVPEGGAQSAIDATLLRLSSELAFQEDCRARRTIDGATVFTILLVGAIGFAATYFLWQGPLVLRFVGTLIAVFATLLIFAGGVPQLMKVHPKFGYEDIAEAEARQTAQENGPTTS